MDNLLSKGDYSDAAQGKATTKGAIEWCKKHNLRQTFKATFTEHGGSENSVILVRAWVHRMHFYDLESRQADLEFVFQPEHSNGYIEPSEFAQLAKRTTKKSTYMRIAKIRNLPFF